MKKRYSREVKEEVLSKVRRGRSVGDVSEEHGLNPKTVRYWLNQDAGKGGSDTLETSRLKRENEQLYRLVGALALEASTGKKKIEAVRSVSVGYKSKVAKEVGVSRGSVYYKPLLPEKDRALEGEIQEVMRANPGYGYRRVALALGINHKRALRVMKKYGLKPARRAKAPKKPLDTGNPAIKVPDILSKITPIAPEVVWVSDFSYFHYRGQVLYLATVLDSFTGEPLGAHISRRHDSTLVLRSLERALESTNQAPSWFHSDQGSEYTSAAVPVVPAVKNLVI